MNINKLIIIAGPSGIGKSYLIEKLLDGCFEVFSRELGINEPALWRTTLPGKLCELKGSKIDQLILHYDLTYPWKRKYHSLYFQDKTLQVISVSKETTLVTLWAKPEIILKRLLARQKRKRQNAKNKCKYIIRGFYKRISSRKVARLYKNPSDLLFLYHEWNEFWDSAVLKAHWLATVKDDRLDYTRFDKSLFHAIVKMDGDFRSDQRALI